MASFQGKFKSTILASITKGRAIMIKGVANIWTPVQDIERAIDFYENVLGLPVVKRDGLWAEVTPTRWRSASTAANACRASLTCG
jgi:hypothetical protein